jgi:hypothetical protein
MADQGLCSLILHEAVELDAMVTSEVIGKVEPWAIDPILECKSHPSEARRAAVAINDLENSRIPRSIFPFIALFLVFEVHLPPSSVIEAVASL